jgi:hypothetical protein
MTTLAAIQGDGWAVIGCDSRSSDESGRPIDMATHKIIENNGILIAGSGPTNRSGNSTMGGINNSLTKNKQIKEIKWTILMKI